MTTAPISNRQNAKPKISSCHSVPDIIIWMAICVGLTASAMSLYDICISSDACSDAAEYTLFGVKFAWGGIIYFLFLGGLFALRTRLKINTLFSLITIGAASAEIHFLRVQYYDIGHWCPVCVVVAISVATIACVRLRSYFWCAGKDRGELALRSLFMVLAIVTGFLTAHIGVERPPMPAAIARAPSTPIKISSLGDMDIWLGNSGSSVEVYYISDWYCGYCRKNEKKIGPALSTVGTAARYTFLDLPVHKESFIIMPYHQSLLLNQKMKYSAGRRALLDVASEGKLPSQVDIIDALNKNGVQHHTADADAMAALQEASALFYRKYGVKSTPSVVILDPTANKHVLLTGTDEITPKKLLEAIKTVASENNN